MARPFQLTPGQVYDSGPRRPRRPAQSGGGGGPSGREPARQAAAGKLLCLKIDGRATLKKLISPGPSPGPAALQGRRASLPAAILRRF